MDLTCFYFTQTITNRITQRAFYFLLCLSNMSFSTNPGGYKLGSSKLGNEQIVGQFITQSNAFTIASGIANGFVLTSTGAGAATWQAPTGGGGGGIGNGNVNITAISSTAFTVGPNGVSNPVIQVDTSAPHCATGLLIAGDATSGGRGSTGNLFISAQGDASTIDIFLDALGSGGVGAVNINKRGGSGAINFGGDLNTTGHVNAGGDINAGVQITSQLDQSPTTQFTTGYVMGPISIGYGLDSPAPLGTAFNTGDLYINANTQANANARVFIFTGSAWTSLLCAS
jgi:hypothetical protein